MKVRSTQDIAAVVRGRRQELGLSQAELAKRSGLSRKWIYEFEAGKPAAEFGSVLRALEPLGLTLHVDPSGDAHPERPPDAHAAIDLDVLLDEYRQR